MSAAGDHYATLGVSPEAESAAIRVAYRDLMRRYHPDVNPTDEAAARATAINEAYACLRDPDERASYDYERSARRTSYGAAAATTGWTPTRTPFRPQHSYVVDLEPQAQPAWKKVASLGIATVVTIVTFTLTSATPAFQPPPPVPVTFVTTAAPPAAELVEHPARHPRERLDEPDRPVPDLAPRTVLR